MTDIDPRYEPTPVGLHGDLHVFRLGAPFDIWVTCSNKIEALLIGFVDDKTTNKAKEYYFWRLCDLIWNREDLFEPLMVRHSWAEDIIKAAIENKYVAVGGAASSGKSHTMAAWGILNWLAKPDETLILLTSTTLREARNPYFSLVGMSNPSSRFDAFGVWSTPKNTWESVNVEVDYTWDTKWGGTYIRLDGEKSPNVLAGEDLYPWLPTEEKLVEDAALLGPESRGYMRMVRAIFFDSDETESVYTESELISSGSMNQVDWADTPTPIAGLDPAFSTNGDRTILYFGLVGIDKNGQFVCELGEAVHLNDDATNTAVPRTYQISRQVKEQCEKRNVHPSNLAVDATGAGQPFADVLALDFGADILRVSFGGKASDKPVSSRNKLKGSDTYFNRVSELWFVGKELCRTRQIFGVSAELAKEITSRNYDTIKSGPNIKMKLESKPEYKSRFGQSPDLADAAFLCVDLARQRHGLISVELPEKMKGGHFRNKKSIKGLAKILSTESLID